jgi:hypothetical protein
MMLTPSITCLQSRCLTTSSPESHKRERTCNSACQAVIQIVSPWHAMHQDSVHECCGA